MHLLLNFSYIIDNELMSVIDLVNIVTNGSNIVMTIDTGNAVDGSKYVCMDKLYVDIKDHSCLIYSVGLSDDWTFEQTLADLGCEVSLIELNVILYGLCYKRIITHQLYTNNRTLFNTNVLKDPCI